MKHAIIIENYNTWNIKQGVDAIKNWLNEKPLSGASVPDIMISTTNDDESIIISYEDTSPDGNINIDNDIKVQGLFNYFMQPITMASHDLDSGKGKITYVNSLSDTQAQEAFTSKFTDFIANSSMPKSVYYAVEGIIGTETFNAIPDAYSNPVEAAPMEVAVESTFKLEDGSKPMEGAFDSEEPAVFNISDIGMEATDDGDIKEITLDDIGASGLEEEVPMLTDEDTKYVPDTVEEVKVETTPNEEIVVNIKEVPYEESVAHITAMFDSLLKRFNLSTYGELEDKIAKLIALAEVATPKVIPTTAATSTSDIPFVIEKDDNIANSEDVPIEYEPKDDTPAEEPEVVHNIILDENPLEGYGDGEETVVEAFVNTSIDWTNEEDILNAIKNLKDDSAAFDFILEHKSDIPRNILLGACSINMHKKATTGEIEVNDPAIKTERLLKI